MKERVKSLELLFNRGEYEEVIKGFLITHKHHPALTTDMALRVSVLRP